MTTRAATPETEAGRALLAIVGRKWDEFYGEDGLMIPDPTRDAILAIEAEALAAARARIEALETVAERADTLLRVGFKDEDFLTANSIPMGATPGVRRALRNLRQALGIAVLSDAPEKP